MSVAGRYEYTIHEETNNSGMRIRNLTTEYKQDHGVEHRVT